MTFAILFLNLLPAVFNSLPGIPAAMKKIIADVTASVAAILASGVVTQPSIDKALAAWLGVVNALKANSGLPVSTLNALAQLQKAIQAAIDQDAIAALGVDWTLTHQIANV